MAKANGYVNGNRVSQGPRNEIRPLSRHISETFSVVHQRAQGSGVGWGVGGGGGGGREARGRRSHDFHGYLWKVI